MNASPPSAPWAPRRAADSVAYSINGLHYHTWQWGPTSGPAALLLHGWMDAGASFQLLADALPGHWRLIAPDWRGFGRTAWAPGGYWFADYLADLDGLLQHLSPDAPVLLIGHSMGGNIAGLYAGIRPARVSRLVNLDGFAIPGAQPREAPARYAHWLRSLSTPPEWRQYPDFAALAARLRQRHPFLCADQARFIAEAWAEPSGTGVRLRADPRHRRPNPVLFRLEEARACWQRVTADTLWLSGAGTFLANGSLAEENGACFRSLTRLEIDNAGHMLHLERPVEVAARIVDWLEPSGGWPVQ